MIRLEIGLDFKSPYIDLYKIAKILKSHTYERITGGVFELLLFEYVNLNGSEATNVVL